VCGIDTDRHRAGMTVSAFAGATLFLSLLATAVPPASPMPLTAALGLGASCLVLCLVAPALVLRRRAARSRARLGAVTSVIADLVGVALAGGSGVTGALTAATRRGNGPAFDLIRRCLHEANLRTRPPWDALSDLAERTGVRELDELASSIRIAGTDGARVRASVRAKAAALRTHRLATLEAQAHEATERMALPVMLLVLGFLLLMGYPAVTHVTSGF
jgi:Flp pilus assembly protein TadB